MAHQRLARDISTDVLVVGAGITGALIADALTSAGLDVAVADRRGLAKGSTVASTALVQYEIDTPLIMLTRKIGKANAVRAWRRSRLAVDALAARFDDLKLTDVARRNSLYLAGNTLGRGELEREHEARRAAGLPSRFLDRKSLRDEFRVRRSAALVSHGNLVIDPRKATLALLQAAAAKGAALFAPADIVNVAPQKGGVVATADNGHRIHCRHLVFATGYELPHGVPRRHHKINSTWAIATVPQRRDALWPDECCVWEAADPYLYVRTTPDGRVICGGGDQEFSDDARRDALIERKTAMLRRKLHRHVSKTRHDGGVRVGRRVRRNHHRPADHRAGSRNGTLPGRARIRRQRHDLCRDRRRRHCRSHHRSPGRRRRSLSIFRTRCGDVTSGCCLDGTIL